MSVLEFIKENTLILDGGMGTLLQKEGLAPGELPERWNLSHPDVIRAVHLAYFKAGSHVVATNTFGANPLKYSHDELALVVEAAVKNARDAQRAACVDHPTFVALDIGPSGKMLKPYGDLAFEDAVSLFAETVKLGVQYGVDLILIETMADTYETKAALLAAKENSDLPVFVSCAFGADGKLLTGADAEAFVAMVEVLDRVLHTVVIEAHTIDDCLVFGQAEQTRAGVARLTFGGHGAHLYEAITECRKLVIDLCIFIETGSNTDRIVEFHAENFAFECGVFHGEHLLHQPLRARDIASKTQCSDGQFVNILGREAEQQRANNLSVHSLIVTPLWHKGRNFNSQFTP